MRLVLCVTGGLLLVIAIITDLVWTALGTHGGGPVTGNAMRILWKGIVAIHHRRPRHRLLSFAGSVILAGTVLLWMGGLWLGVLMIFSGNPESVTSERTHVPATFEQRVYFTGSVFFTYGSAQWVPNGPRWRMATIATGALGLGAITLSITYLMQVLSSVVLKRTLGAYVSDSGGTPEGIIGRAWTGEQFDGLVLFLSQLTGMLHQVTEQHLAYPVLHYFHSEQLRTAASVRIPSLYETTLILAEGVVRPIRPTPMTLQPVREALSGFAQVIEAEFVRAAPTAPPPPPLRPLRDLGVPVIDDAEFAAAAAKVADIRRFLLALVEGDGWSWNDVYRQ